MSHLLQNPTHRRFKSQVVHETIQYSQEENETWAYMFDTQMAQLPSIAHEKILSSIEEFDLPASHIPQLEEVSQKLHKKTGWQVVRVEDLIESKDFFELLANRYFPSTVYIRGHKELTLSRDPDVFHEVFGHCPLLLDADYATLFEKFGQLGLAFDDKQKGFLQRLFWFTLETGLVNTPSGVKVYGGSLLSSIKESHFSLYGESANRSPYKMVNLFRTPYRADLIQSQYYILPQFETLLQLFDDVEEIKRNIDLAFELGEFPASFPIEAKFEKYTSYNLCKKILCEEQSVAFA